MDNFFFKGGGPLNGGEGAEIFGRGGYTMEDTMVL